MIIVIIFHIEIHDHLFHLLELQMKLCTVVLDIMSCGKSLFPSCLTLSHYELFNCQTMMLIKLQVLQLMATLQSDLI